MEAVCKAGDPDPVGFNGVHGHSCQNASELRKGDFHGTQSSPEDSLEKVALELGPQGTRSGRAGSRVIRVEVSGPCRSLSRLRILFWVERKSGEDSKKRIWSIWLTFYKGHWLLCRE